jgi:hypothetical protein
MPDAPKSANSCGNALPAEREDSPPANIVIRRRPGEAPELHLFPARFGPQVSGKGEIRDGLPFFLDLGLGNRDLSAVIMRRNIMPDCHGQDA